MSFKLKSTLEQRSRESARILKKYPGRIPVIIDKSERSSSLPDIDRNKFLISQDMTIGQFQFILRRRIKLQPKEALYIFTRDSIPRVNDTVAEVYQRERDEDGFLYLTYSGENTFGDV